MTQTQSYNPTHQVFNVLDDGENTRWTQIGVAWTHKDNEGLSLAINCTPVIKGKTVIRKIKPKNANKKAAN